MSEGLALTTDMMLGQEFLTWLWFRSDNGRVCAAYMVKMRGSNVGDAADSPLHTVTTKDRFGLVTVSIEGTPYILADIGMRMLTPRELARAQGLPSASTTA